MALNGTEAGPVDNPGFHSMILFFFSGSAKLKNSNKQICIDPKLKWLQEYLEKYLPK